MQDIASLLVDTMQSRQCSSMCAFLILEGGRNVYEPTAVSNTLHKPVYGKNKPDERQFNKLGAGNRGRKGVPTYAKFKLYDAGQ